MTSIYDLSALDNRGNLVPLSQYRGSVLLIVNTASRCGFTPQYRELEALYSKYKGEGLVILGFPCDQFGGQEPGTNEEIAQFCEVNFGVTFPLMQKIEVNGKGAHPVFQFLRQRAGGWFGNRIKWNFTKFLISRDGTRIKRFSPIRKPASIEQEIRSMLAE